jgi:putative RecB family exonuclease
MGVVFEVPTSLSPSRVEAFTACPLAFRFASIEKLPELPSIHATRGSLVHRALELAYTHPAGERTAALFHRCLDAARDEYRELPEFTGLALSGDELAAFDEDCRCLIDTYLTMEDPRTVHPIGLELRLSAEVGALSLRGIIDRLELRDGELVVTDYKTGRAPSVKWEQRSLAGVHFYSFLCEQVFGRRPAAIRLMYLRSGETIEATPSEQSLRFITTRTTAVWKAVERACLTGDFRSRPGALCPSCSYQPWCPSFGGDPDRAAIEAPVALGPVLVHS